MERDDVKSQITTMMICRRRNSNNSLFNVIIVMSRTPCLSIDDNWDQLSKDRFERRTSTGSGLFAFLNSCYD